jgi:putative aldouronate transport system permease protein
LRKPSKAETAYTGKEKMGMSRKRLAYRRGKPLQIGSHSIAIAFSIICLIPFLIVVSSSLTNELALNERGFQIWPSVFDLTAYHYIFKSPAVILRSYGVTIASTAATMVLGLLFMAMIAFPLARENCRFRRPLSFFIFFTMLFNGGLVPTYIMVTQYLHLKDTFAVLVLPSLINAFYIIMIRTFFQKLPGSLYESAKIDGASEFRIFYKIALPLSIPVLASVAFFMAMAKWNDWYSALLYIDNSRLFPLQYLLYRIQSSAEQLLKAMGGTAGVNIDLRSLPGNNLLMAMVVVAAGPMLFIFPLFQKYFVQGLTVGAVKG